MLVAPSGPVEDVGIVRTLDDEKAGETALQSRQRVIDEDVAAGHLQRQLDDRRATRGHSPRVHVRGDGRPHRSFLIDAVEDLPDEMERGGRVRTPDTEEDPHGLADLRLRRVFRRERADGAVEDEVFRAQLPDSADGDLDAERGHGSR
jgi:hypothetical protein